MQPIFHSKIFHDKRTPCLPLFRRIPLFPRPTKRLAQAHAAFQGSRGNCLATYVPWLLHEPQEGTFTFGETAAWLDLEAF